MGYRAPFSGLHRAVPDLPGAAPNLGQFPRIVQLHGTEAYTSLPHLAPRVKRTSKRTSKRTFGRRGEDMEADTRG